MNISQAIEYIYPTFNFWIDYKVVDISDWNWSILTWLNTEIEQPTQAELETAWAECTIQKDIETKILRMKEIREQIIALWYTDELPSDTRVDAIVTAKKTALVNEWNTIKSEVDSTYDATLIDDVITSLFG
jgi:hypothetical protein